MALKDFMKKIQPWVDKTKPVVDKAKGYSSQAVGYIGKQVEQTPIFIKTEEEYNIHSSAKRAIFIALDGNDPIAEKLRLLMPLWGVQAWTDAAELRYFEINGNDMISKNLRIEGPIEMRVSYMGEEYARYHTYEEIQLWWKNRCYKKDDDSEAETPSQGPKKEPTEMADLSIEVDPLKDIETPKKRRSKKTTK